MTVSVPAVANIEAVPVKAFTSMVLALPPPVRTADSMLVKFDGFSAPTVKRASVNVMPASRVTVSVSVPEPPVSVSIVVKIVFVLNVP